MSKRYINSRIVFPYVKGHCRVCGDKLTGRRRTFCSKKCVTKLLDHTRWPRIRKIIFKRDGGVCQICGIELDSKKQNGFHVDHIKPVSKGGSSYELDNLQLLCPSCNLSKSDKWEED